LQSFNYKYNTIKGVFDQYFDLISAIVIKAWHSAVKTITGASFAKLTYVFDLSFG
jgi:hypothetical protein